MREQQLLADIVRRVDTGDVARRMVDVFRAEIAAYRRLPDNALNGQVYDVSKRNIDLFFKSLVEDRELSEEDLQPFRRSARNRAAEGLPLLDLLHAYRLGGRMGWEALVHAAGPDEQSALLPGVVRLMEHIDRVSDAVTETYEDWSRHLASEEERIVRELFDALLGEGPLDAHILAVAEKNGFPVVDDYSAFVLAVRGANAHVHAQRAADLRDRGIVAVTEGDRVVGLVPRGQPPPDFGADPVELFASTDVVARSDLRVVIADLRSLVSLGLRLGRNGRMEVDDHLPELLLVRSPSVGERLRRRAIGPLEEQAARRRANLLETLETYIACDFDRRDAAERLQVHPNTLDYRLRRVEDLTGLKLGRASDMALICLALKQRAAVA